MKKYNHPQHYWIKDKISNLSEHQKLMFYNVVDQLTSLDCPSVFSVVKEIIDECKALENMLKPLNDYGIYFDLWLSGECVSDLILGHHNRINNLDFIISFKPFMDLFIDEGLNNYFNEFASNVLSKNEINKDFDFNTWEIPFKSIEASGVDNGIKLKLFKKINVDLINLCINSFGIQTSQSLKLEDNMLGSVSFITAPGSKYRCNINVVEGSLQEFVATYNFDINKVSVELISSFLSIEGYQNKVETPEDFFKRLKFEMGFIRDVVDKKISINVADLSLVQIEDICENQYGLIKVKYNPKEWRVNFSDITIENDQMEDFSDEDVRQNMVYIKHFLRKHELELELDLKMNSEEKIKKI